MFRSPPGAWGSSMEGESPRNVSEAAEEADELAPCTDDGGKPNDGMGGASQSGGKPEGGGTIHDDGIGSLEGDDPRSVHGTEVHEQSGGGADVQGDGVEHSAVGKEGASGWWKDLLGANFGFMRAEDRAAEQEEKEADQNFVMGFLETEVFQGGMDQQTMLARESLRVEGYRSVEELRSSNQSIASLVAKGVRRRPHPARLRRETCRPDC